MVIEHAVRPTNTPEIIAPEPTLLSMVFLEQKFLGKTVTEVNLPMIFQGKEASTEREIVSEAKTGDEQAQACIYVAYHDRVANYLLAKTGSAETAEDLASDSMGKVLRCLYSFDFRDGVNFSHWVFTIAHNQMASFYRREARYVQHALDTLTGDVIQAQPSDKHLEGLENRVTSTVLYLSALAHIESLPENQRNVVHSRFVKGLTISQTAELLEKSSGNIKALQHKGIARLRKLMIEPPATKLSQTRPLALL